jgi:protein-disulfide isomerase
MEDETGVLTVPVSDADHIQGALDAPITLVEYGDYECPHCGRAYPIVKEVQKRLGKRLRFVFRNFPLNNIHQNAEMAAEAAEAAGAQGRFWEMHDALYEHQEELAPDLLARLAVEIHLDLSSFKNDLDERRFRERVRKDFMGGVRSGVNGTPTFYINGRRFNDSWDPETLTVALNAAGTRR